MIKRDQQGFVVDMTGDGGDSANRAGILALCGYIEPLQYYVDSQILVCRHPNQVPWNNPLNFGRDQLMPFIAGLHFQGSYGLVRKIFWKHARRLFFTQSIERDVKGSKKYLWPHEFYKDSRPSPLTVLWPKKIPLETGFEVESRVADYRDILLPGDIWTIILAGRMWYLYWFGIIGYPFFMLSLWSHCKHYEGQDEGQIIAACVVQGPWALRYYRTHRKMFLEKLRKYWVQDRDQVEIYNGLSSLVMSA